MPQPDSTKRDCPHCNQPYYPQWNPMSIEGPPPNRQGPRNAVTVGKMWTTTCTSCDQPIIEIEVLPIVEGVPVSSGDVENDQVFPVEDEIVIAIVVQVFIDLENLNRSQNGESEMTEKEEDSRRNDLYDTFSRIFEVVKKSGDAVRVIGQFLSFLGEWSNISLPPPEDK